MTFARLHQVVTYLMAGLGMIGLTFGEELSLPSAVVILVATALTWFVPDERVASPGWGGLWTRVVLGAFALQVARASLGAALLPLGLEYAALLQISRLSSRRTARDHENIAALAFLHLMAATVLSTGVEWAVIFTGFVIVTPWMLALTHMRKEIEGRYSDEEIIDGPLPEEVQRVLASRQLLGSGFLLGTAALAVPMFLVTAAFFILFPRVGMGFLTLGDTGGRQVAGFGGNVDLGGFGLIRDDPMVVLRVRPLELPERPPPRRAFRLRGTSFDHYEAGSWTRSRSTPRRLRSDEGFFALRADALDLVDEELELILDPLEDPVLFLPEGTVGLTMPPRIVMGRNVGRAVQRRAGLDLRYTDGDGLELRYRAHIDADATGWGGALDAEERRSYVQLPPGQERVIELARRVVGDARKPMIAAERIVAFLRDSGRFRYTLQLPETAERDPLEVFLFEARAGHCEYFSTALAVMLRAVDVPARNVTGFLGGTFNEYGRYYAIRNGDAHSWVEVHDGEKWRTLDSTPPSREAMAPPSGPLETLREMMDALRIRWSRDVVGYSFRAQLGALRQMWTWMQERRAPDVERPSAERADERAEGAESRRWGPSVAAWISLSLMIVALGAGGLWLLRRRRGRSAAERLSPQQREAIRRYRSLERRLARAGHPRPPSVTPLQHLEHLRAVDYAEGDEAAEITRGYIEARFGSEG